MAKNNTLVSNFLQTTGKSLAANDQRHAKPTHLHTPALKTPKTMQRHTTIAKCSSEQLEVRQSFKLIYQNSIPYANSSLHRTPQSPAATNSNHFGVDTYTLTLSAVRAPPGRFSSRWMFDFPFFFEKKIAKKNRKKKRKPLGGTSPQAKFNFCKFIQCYNSSKKSQAKQK